MSAKVDLCPISDKKNVTVCLENAAAFIDLHSPYDFVGLQEATNWKALRQQSQYLKDMSEVSYNAGVGTIVTFYDAGKYELDLTHNTIEDYMADTGRPLLVLFFQQKLAVINLHAGHANDIFHLDAYLKRLSNPELMRKLQTYELIVMGDFNHDLSGQKHFDLLDRHLTGINVTPTCCDNNLNTKVRYAFDQILTTFSKAKPKAYKIKTASDHLPIISTIKAQKLTDKQVQMIVAYMQDHRLPKKVYRYMRELDNAIDMGDTKDNVAELLNKIIELSLKKIP